MYAKGIGISQDMTEAIRLYKAVKRSPVDEFSAQIELGRIYSRGLGVPADKSAASKWYSAALTYEGIVGDCDELEEAKAYLATATSRDDST